jgi:3-oxoadipate enol-lactonase
MAFFNHCGDRYYYFDAGAGAPVVLLHGLGNTGRAWTPQVAEMVRLGHRVIALDLLGHGASGPVDRAFTAYDQGRVTLALLEFLGLESAAFVGLSLGGMVALEVAIMSPEAVDKLIVAGTFRTMATPNRQHMLNAWIETLRQPDGCLKRFRSSWIDLVGKVFADSPLGMAWYQAWHAQAATQDSRNAINWCEGMKRYDVSLKLGFITAPTLVLTGAEDPMSPASEAQGIADRIRSAAVDVVPGGGHVFNVSSAHEFNRRIHAFLPGNQHG